MKYSKAILKINEGKGMVYFYQNEICVIIQKLLKNEIIKTIKIKWWNFWRIILYSRKIYKKSKNLFKEGILALSYIINFISKTKIGNF